MNIMIIMQCGKCGIVDADFSRSAPCVQFKEPDRQHKLGISTAQRISTEDTETLQIGSVNMVMD
jgi:hypothetical protein